MTTEREIEEAAAKYSEKKHPGGSGLMAWEAQGFTAGAKWLLEKAAQGFEEWWPSVGQTIGKVAASKAWAAARLSMMKENEALRKRLEGCKQALENVKLRRDEYYQERCDFAQRLEEAEGEISHALKYLKSAYSNHAPKDGDAPEPEWQMMRCFEDYLAKWTAPTSGKHKGEKERV